MGDILERARQRRLQWFGHVRREGEEGVLRKVEKVQMTGNRQPGREDQGELRISWYRKT